MTRTRLAPPALSQRTGGREQVVGAELVSDLRRLLGGVPVLERAAAGDYLEARDLAKPAAHLVAHAVGEIGVGRVAEVVEWENSDHARSVR
jgi:hypothetical protein